MTSNTICTFPWVHMSSHFEGDMIICCNTYDTETAKIKDENGNNWNFKNIENPLTFFNTEDYKKIRKQMMDGEEPERCKKCYDIERLGGTSIRQNSLREFDIGHLLEHTNKETGEIDSVQLQYVHLMWGNKCNLMCKMCDPMASDQLIEEYERLETKKDISFYKNINLNWDYELIEPILKAIAPYIKILNVTGGEPLINNEFLKYCQYLVNEGFAKDIKLAFHTNLTVLPTKIVEVWKHFKSVDCKVSVDAAYEDYEYIRYPGKWKTIEKNVKELTEIAKDVPELYVTFFTVFTAFNVHGIPKLIDYLCTYDFGSLKNVNPFPNTLMVTHPYYGDSKLIPANFKVKITEELEALCEKYKKDTYQAAINMLKANLITMNSKHLKSDHFYNFVIQQDLQRTISSKNIIPWYGEYNT